MTDVPSTSWVDYGFDTAYGQTSGNDSLVTNHTVTLTGLADGKTYHYSVRSGGGNYSHEIRGSDIQNAGRAPARFRQCQF